MEKPTLILAAPKSGSGKTLITISLMKALSMRKLKVQAFKCGPDYIDPMFHKKILGIPSKNIDLFFTDEETTRGLFLLDNDSDISIVEGVMGLYDGLGGISEEASTYHLAKALSAPIILIINARGMGRSLLAEIQGFLSMDEAKLIQGVILNNITGMFYETIAPVIEEELNLKVYGYFEPQKDLHLESRYLGLKLPEEIKDIQEMAVKAAGEVERTIQVDALWELAKSQAPQALSNPESNQGQTSNNEKKATQYVERKPVESKQPPRIAIARDEAFCFYYEDNLRMLKEAGAELVEFSPIHDKALPQNIQGLILGGGYPELFAQKLAANEPMKQAIKKALDQGIPSLAECGGFMYLHEEITTEDGKNYEMVGAIPGSCAYKGKLVRFGYITLSEQEESFTQGKKHEIKAHEFHYFDSTNNGESCLATKPVGGRHWTCAHVNDRHWWGFAHLYYPSNPDFVKDFVMKCSKYTNGRKNTN